LYFSIEKKHAYSAGYRDRNDEIKEEEQRLKPTDNGK